MSKTILVVDDHANVRTLIKEYLAEHGYSRRRRARRRRGAGAWRTASSPT